MANPKQAIQDRLEELRAEYERGSQMLVDLEAEAQEVRDGLLRISGAIKVLEELEELEELDAEDPQAPG